MTHIKKHTRNGMYLAAGVAAALATVSVANAEDYRIGALNPITGDGGPYGEGMLNGIQLAAKEVNDNGGAAGRMLKVYAADSQTRAEAAVLAAKKLLEINEVQTIAGTWASSVTLAVMPMTEAANVILMHSSGAPDIANENDKGFTWGYQSPNNVFGWAFAKAALEREFKTAATLAYNNASALGQAEYFKETWEKAGQKLTAEVIYEPGQTSYRTELNRVLSSDPELIVLAGYTPDATIILKEWYQTGRETKFVMPGWSASPDLIKALGPVATEGILSIQNVPTDGGAFEHFHTGYKEAYGGAEPTIYGAETYDEIISLALAIEAAGPDATNEQINAAIRQVTNAPGEVVNTFAKGVEMLKAGKDIDYNGASSDLEMTDRGYTVPDFGVFEIKDGKLDRVGTISYAQQD